KVRNAASCMLVTVFSEATWKAMALRQLEFFRILRGAEAEAAPFVPAVPCTSNTDVLALAHYWTEQIARAGASASDTYHQLVYSCWRAVLDRVQRVAKHGAPHDVYAHNTEFWNAMLLLTTQSDAADHEPEPWMCHLPTSSSQHRNAEAIDT